MRPERTSAAGWVAEAGVSANTAAWARELANIAMIRGSRKRSTGKTSGCLSVLCRRGGWTSFAEDVQNSTLPERVSSRGRERPSNNCNGDRWMWGQNFSELFSRGGPVMWPLLGCSVLAVALISERVWAYWRLRVAYGPLLAELKSHVEQQSLERLLDRLVGSDRPLHRVVAAYLRHREAEKSLRDQVVVREASQQVSRYDSRLNWLGILTHATPLLGLLGTVAGLVGAFHQIELKGGQVQPGDLASGIWSALLTTVCGLTIALPCLAAYHLLQSVAGRAAMQMQWMTSQLDEWLFQEESAGAPPGPPSVVDAVREVTSTPRAVG